MRVVKLKITLVLVGYLLVIGCTFSTPETFTSTAGSTIPVTAVPSPTAAKPPSPNSQPTLSPAETPYPTPETPLNEDGPWLIFPAALTNPRMGYPLAYLWAMNADGTGLTLLDPDPVERYTLRPDNTQDSRSTLVYITRKANNYLDLTLKSITLPDLEKMTITPLVGPDEVDFNGDPLLALDYGGW